jgi:multisubunit Na+/H+ antiporter MnhB subunit
MLAIRIIALVLILASAVGLVYAGFDELPRELGGTSGHMELAKSGFDVLMWTGVGGMLLGGLLLVGLAWRR